MARKADDIDNLLAALGADEHRVRCDAVRSLCPCRNNHVRDVAVWRKVFDRALGRSVDANDPGVRRLWRWLKHRIACQPARGTKDEEVIDKARRYLPRLFDNCPPPQISG